MRRMALGTLLIVGVSMFAPGCLGRAIKEGAGVALGASGSHTVMVEAGSLVDYGKVEAGEFKDGFGGKTPPELFSFLPTELEAALAKNKRIAAGASGMRTLVIRGEIVYYENSKLMGQALGPLEEAVSRVQLVDKSSGRTVGSAVCVGRTEASSNSGVRSKAAGLAKGIVGWIETGYPKPKENKE